jgi:hypothetical protein
MKATAVIVNTARGGLIVTDDLVRALKEGRIAGAALDVTDPEPLPMDHPIRNLPRVLVTPHAAWYSEEAEPELRRRAARTIVEALRGERPTTPQSEACAPTIFPPGRGKRRAWASSTRQPVSARLQCGQEAAPANSLRMVVSLGTHCIFVQRGPGPTADSIRTSEVHVVRKASSPQRGVAPYFAASVRENPGQSDSVHDMRSFVRVAGWIAGGRHPGQPTRPPVTRLSIPLRDRSLLSSTRASTPVATSCLPTVCRCALPRPLTEHRWRTPCRCG